MQTKSLVDLLHDLKQEMLRLGYSKHYMASYRTRCKRFLKFAQERGEIFYSESLGLDYLEKYFHLSEKDSNNTLTDTDSHAMRFIRMIGDFQLHQAILRRQHKKHIEILNNPYFIGLSNKFKLYCIAKGYSNITTDHYVKLSSRFMDYLVSQNITDCKSICLSSIHAYVKTLASYTYETVGQNVRSMRAFFRFLFEIGEIQTDLAGKTLMIKARKQARIPSTWTVDELKKLIGAIDRGNPRGKRDYAIILLACCLGIRCMDIKNLKMEHFYWEEKKLVFTQSKTRSPVTLPLTPEVGWAVINYLKYGRPQIDSPYIFIKHNAPFGPFAENSHLHQIIKRYVVLAHLPTIKKRRGMHSLRHTMASILLEKNTPLPIISNILGHIDSNSTAVYLKVDITKLKECALDFEEVANHE